jgi:hypothetical protein
MPELKEKKQTVTVSPFTVEADHPTNANLMIQGIGNVSLRSALKHTKTVIHASTRNPVQRMESAPAGLIGGLPMNIRGMTLRVDPAKLTWEVEDPLHDDEETCEKIRLAIRRSDSIAYTSGEKITGVPKREGKLNVHQMKTLVREVCWLLDAEHVKVVKGAEPDMEDVDSLPGRYLTNPFNPIQVRQPQFEDEMEAWIERLNMLS